MDTIYEITWQLPSGDWEYQKVKGMTFQGACKLGVAGCGPERRLIRVERLRPSAAWDAFGVQSEMRTDLSGDHLV
jgi:hypothetical protein